MEYIIGASIISTVGYDFILKTLQRTSDNIYSLICNIHSTTKCDEIRDMDLEFQCKTISYTINYCIKKYCDDNNEYINDDKHILIKNTINSIQDNLNVIEKNLDIIKKTLDYNNNLWLPILFSKNFSEYIKIIIQEKKILDTRMQLFLNIINI